MILFLYHSITISVIYGSIISAISTKSGTLLGPSEYYFTRSIVWISCKIKTVFTLKSETFDTTSSNNLPSHKLSVQSHFTPPKNLATIQSHKKKQQFFPQKHARNLNRKHQSKKPCFQCEKTRARKAQTRAKKNTHTQRKNSRVASSGGRKKSSPARRARTSASRVSCRQDTLATARISGLRFPITRGRPRIERRSQAAAVQLRKTNFAVAAGKSRHTVTYI